MCTPFAPTDFGWRVTDTPNPAQAVSRDNRCCPNKIPFVRSSERRRSILQGKWIATCCPSGHHSVWHHCTAHIHRFVSFPSFVFLTHLVSDCYPCCRSSLHFTPLSTFPDVGCWVSNHRSSSRCPISCLCADTAFSLRSILVPFRRSVRRCTIPVRSDHQDCQMIWSGWMHTRNTPSRCFFCRLVPECWSGNKSHRLRSEALIRTEGFATSRPDFNRPILKIRSSRSESSDCMSVRSLCTRGITTSHLDPHLLHRSSRNDDQNINRVCILRIGL